MGNSTWIVISLIVLLAISGFFSASETAYSSLNRLRLKSMANEGNTKAVKALALTDNYDKLLNAVLVGNTIINIVTSALATVLFVGFFGSMGVSIATLVTTVLVLMFAEITPKSLAKEAPEKVAIRFASTLTVLVKIIRPLNFLLNKWRDLIIRVFHVSGSSNISQEELLNFVTEVREDGGINMQEEEMIRTVIEFDEMEAGDILTPRVDISAVDLRDSMEHIQQVFRETGYSRLPVYDKTADSIKGIILEKDFSYLMAYKGSSIESIIRPVVFSTESVKIKKLLRELRMKKSHMAIIVDEYGGTVGLITIEDIIEELVGEIWDEHDEIVHEITPLTDGEYEVLGGTAMDELEDLLGLKVDSQAATIGGWIMEQLETIPEPGESVTYEGYYFIVEETLRNRITKVLLKKAEPMHDTTKE